VIEELGNLLAQAANEFVCTDDQEPAQVIAAKRVGVSGSTLGVVFQPAPNRLPGLLTYYLETVGCDSVVLVAGNLQSASRLARKLCQAWRPDWRDRVGLTSITALRLLFCNRNFQAANVDAHTPKAKTIIIKYDREKKASL